MLSGSIVWMTSSGALGHRKERKDGGRLAASVFPRIKQPVAEMLVADLQYTMGEFVGWQPVSRRSRKSRDEERGEANSGFSSCWTRHREYDAHCTGIAAQQSLSD
ncbi:hypothetical protein LINPERHAP2_LOCUS33365 [Linum perenne]